VGLGWSSGWADLIAAAELYQQSALSQCAVLADAMREFSDDIIGAKTVVTLGFLALQFEGDEAMIKFVPSRKQTRTTNGTNFWIDR